MDNACYRSVRMNEPPAQGNRMADITEWLRANYIFGVNINYLLEVVNQKMSAPS